MGPLLSLLVVTATTTASIDAATAADSASFDVSAGLVASSPTALQTGMMLGGSLDVRLPLAENFSTGVRIDAVTGEENDRVAAVRHTEGRFFIVADVHARVEIAEVALRVGGGPVVVWEDRVRHDGDRLPGTDERESRVYLGAYVEGAIGLPLIENFWLELALGPQTTWVDGRFGVGMTGTGRLRVVW